MIEYFLIGVMAICFTIAVGIFISQPIVCTIGLLSGVLAALAVIFIGFIVKHTIKIAIRIKNLKWE